MNSNELKFFKLPIRGMTNFQFHFNTNFLRILTHFLKLYFNENSEEKSLSPNKRVNHGKSAYSLTAVIYHLLMGCYYKAKSNTKNRTC